MIWWPLNYNIKYVKCHPFKIGICTWNLHLKWSLEILISWYKLECEHLVFMDFSERNWSELSSQRAFQDRDPLEMVISGKTFFYLHAYSPINFNLFTWTAPNWGATKLR